MVTLVELTAHADDRLKERLGLPKRARLSAAQRAFDQGRHHTDTRGALRRFLDDKWLKYQLADNVRIYAQHIWFFAGGTLITVYEVPKDLKGGIK